MPTLFHFEKNKKKKRYKFTRLPSPKIVTQDGKMSQSQACVKKKKSRKNSMIFKKFSREFT